MCLKAVQWKGTPRNLELLSIGNFEYATGACD